MECFLTRRESEITSFEIRYTVMGRVNPGGESPDRELGLPIGATVKNMQNDGSHVQTGIYSQNGTILEYNWSYDTL